MKPNIVILLIDALRAKNLSFHGYPQEFDTNLKKIASENIFFSNHFSSANATYPSLTSLYTGKYPINHGIIHTMPYTPPEQISKLKKNKFWLPLFLKNKGYDNYSISLTGAWFKKGFDYTQEEPKKDAYRKINDKKFIKKILKIIPDPLFVLLKKILRRDPKTDFPKPNETVDLAISKIKKSKKPFFMFLHFEDVHYPWATTPTPKVKGENTKRKILKSIPSISQKKYVKRRMFNTNTNSAEEVEAKYNHAIKNVDKEVGRFHQFLKDEKLWDNTIFILMSDHGFSIAEHGIYLNHHGLYDETLHVPLVMHLPGIKSKKIHHLVQNIDITQTILDYLNEKKIKTDGKSMLNLINNGKPIRDSVYAFDASCGKRWAIRSKTKKVIFTHDNKCYACKASHGDEIEEYDLTNDPNELKNIYSGKYKLEDYNLNYKL